MSRMLHAALAVVLALTVAPAHAASGQQLMEQFTAGLKTLRGEFTQTMLDPDGVVAEETRGELWVSRPDRFRLEYRPPYDQIYVADGDKVWMYDKDLEQITVKTQGEALGSTPALLLSSTDPLTKHFVVTELGEHEGLTWLELKPRRGDSSFESVHLAFEGASLRIMEMLDGFGQRTRLSFEKIDRNPRIETKLFQFTPPPGVDVIGEDP